MFDTHKISLDDLKKFFLEDRKNEFDILDTVKSISNSSWRSVFAFLTIITVF